MQLGTAHLQKLENRQTLQFGAICATWTWAVMKPQRLKPQTLNDVLLLIDADFNTLNTFQKDVWTARIIPRLHGSRQPMIVKSCAQLEVELVQNSSRQPEDDKAHQVTPVIYITRSSK
jgi:hypothetical protein